MARSALPWAKRVATFLVALALTWTFVVKTAAAQAAGTNGKGVPIFVLDIDYEDTDDQAEALTAALRSRVRSAEGWSLVESQHALGTLVVALKCPPKPDANCLQKIADQVHADRFIWGQMSKAGASQVAVDVHYWQRGKGDTAARETYSENLKDPNDESLRRIATRLFAKLTGTGALGTVVVTANVDTGTVLVDGSKRANLEAGRARLDLAPGWHTIEVHSSNMTAPIQRIHVGLASESEARFMMVAPTATKGEASGGGSAKTVLGWSLVAAGAILGGVAVYEGVQWFQLKSDQENLRQQIPIGFGDVCNADPVAFNQPGVPRDKIGQACDQHKDAVKASTIAWITGGAGVVALTTGVVLLATGSSSSESGRSGRADSKRKNANWRITPMAGLNSAQMNFELRY